MLPQAGGAVTVAAVADGKLSVTVSRRQSLAVAVCSSSLHQLGRPELFTACHSCHTCHLLPLNIGVVDNLLYLYPDFPKSQHPCIHELSHNQSADAVVELVALSVASLAVVFASGTVEGISFEASGQASNAVLRDERTGTCRRQASCV